MWPQGFTWTTEQAETVAVWAVPNGLELTRKAEASIPGLLDEFLGDRAPTVLEALLQFEAAHPHDEPHYYLSLVATHDDHRGQGIGEALLAENLAADRRRHFPAYLESSNPKNLARYGRLGLSPVDEFALAGNGPASPRCGAPRVSCGARTSARAPIGLVSGVRRLGGTGR